MAIRSSRSVNWAHNEHSIVHGTLFSCFCAIAYFSYSLTLNPVEIPGKKHVHQL